MTADLLIIQLLEAVEVGDDGVYLKPRTSNYVNAHSFDIIHPVHGNVGYIDGKHNPINNSFKIGYLHIRDHPKYRPQTERPTHPDYYDPRMPDAGGAQHRDTYSGLSRTFVRSALRSLRQHIPNLETIIGNQRITGTHAIAMAKTDTDDRANTSIRIPRSIRKSV
jgi:hypothetical protein